MGLASGRSTEESVAIAFVGALPDIIGWSEKAVRKDMNVWKWYNAVHDIDFAGISLLLVSFFALAFWSPFLVLCVAAWCTHVLLDVPFHKPGLRWWLASEGLWTEILMWFVVLMFLLRWYHVLGWGA